jgi:hypothetical protein
VRSMDEVLAIALASTIVARTAEDLPTMVAH